MSNSIFISVGRTSTPEQESFVAAIEAYLRAQALEPRTIGRNYFRNGQPLKIIAECMKECSGAIIIAFERIHIEKGLDQRGSPAQSQISGLNLTTVWNQIEASLAYSYGRPLLMLVEKGLKAEGLLETGNDWWVQSVTLDQSTLFRPEFTQVFNDWKASCSKTEIAANESVDLAKLSVRELLENLTVAQLWATVGGLFALLSGTAILAYWLGTKLHP